MNSFIKACEVWTPTPDDSMLEFSSGLFGSATAFGAITKAMCFGRGEGLPGRAWDEGKPIMLRQLTGSYFRRGAAAEAAGMRCAIAMPVFLEERLNAVLVFFCGDAEASAGALELWANDPRVSTDMTLIDGHFGAGGQAMDELSRDAYLPRGIGLPGLAWQRGAAVLIDDLGQSTRFLRGDGAQAMGVKRGLAIPCTSRGVGHHVLNFLSASATPIARRIESWAPNADGTTLQRLFGYCEIEGALPAGDEGPSLSAATGSIASAFATAVPRINEEATIEPQGIGAAAKALQLQALVAIPVVSDDSVSEVVVLYF